LSTSLAKCRRRPRVDEYLAQQLAAPAFDEPIRDTRSTPKLSGDGGQEGAKEQSPAENAMVRAVWHYGWERFDALARKVIHRLQRFPATGIYVMQSWTDHFDETLTADKLPDLDKILKPPKGWTFSVKTLDRDLTIAPQRPDCAAHSLVDNLKNVYAGCGFDKACSYTP
jgi:hypothetical protein